MEFDYNKLKGRIVEIFGSNTSFAEALGVSNVVISEKLNQKRQITRNDIIKWTELLKIPIDEIGIYFFTLRV